MTYNEIIKALECCGTGICKAECFGYFMTGTNECTTKLTKNALDLINRLQAENERLKKGWRADVIETANVKAEAYKEFAERLTDKIGFNSSMIDVYEEIDNLLKETVGEDNV